MNKPLTTVELVPVGTATVVVLPQHVLDELHLKAGDKVELSKDESGGLSLKPANPFDQQMAVAQAIIDEDQAILTALAQ